MLFCVFFSCQKESPSKSVSDYSENLTNTKLSPDQEYTEIGKFVDGEFEFTASEEMLQENFAANVESNLGIPGGQLTEALVIMPNEENGYEKPLFALRGSLGDDNSAQLSDFVTVVTGPEGETYGLLRKYELFTGWICTGCTVCVNSAHYKDCKCIQSGGGNTSACKKEVPKYQWEFRDVIF